NQIPPHPPRQTSTVTVPAWTEVKLVSHAGHFIKLPPVTNAVLLAAADFNRTAAFCHSNPRRILTGPPPRFNGCHGHPFPDVATMACRAKSIMSSQLP